jgi:AhpD family alkylhydroperoxidase
VVHPEKVKVALMKEPLGGYHSRMTTTRIAYAEVAPEALKAMLALETHVRRAGLPRPLIELIYMRVSQINRCAYCIDMHSKDARAAGETEQRLYALTSWRETPFFTEAERAALAWAEAVTELGRDHVSDEVFAEARRHFEERELVELTMAVATINAWNRLGIAFRLDVGGYAPRAK